MTQPIAEEYEVVSTDRGVRSDMSPYTFQTYEAADKARMSREVYPELWVVRRVVLLPFQR